MPKLNVSPLRPVSRCHQRPSALGSTLRVCYAIWSAVHRAKSIHRPYIAAFRPSLSVYCAIWPAKHESHGHWCTLIGAIQPANTLYNANFFKFSFPQSHINFAAKRITIKLSVSPSNYIHSPTFNSSGKEPAKSVQSFF